MVDPRGQRVAAALTAAVLAIVLLTGSAWLLAAQAGVFAAGALAGVAASPYARLFARFLRPRLGPPAELEDARPPRFAQFVGLLLPPPDSSVSSAAGHFSRTARSAQLWPPRSSTLPLACASAARSTWYSAAPFPD